MSKDKQILNKCLKFHHVTENKLSILQNSKKLQPFKLSETQKILKFTGLLTN